MRVAAVRKIRCEPTLGNSMWISDACVGSATIKGCYISLMRNLIRAIGGILNRIFPLNSVGGATLCCWIVERTLAQASSVGPSVPDAEFSESYANQTFED
jgi:hypothetical protein